MPNISLLLTTLLGRLLVCRLDGERSGILVKSRGLLWDEWVGGLVLWLVVGRLVLWLVVGRLVLWLVVGRLVLGLIVGRLVGWDMVGRLVWSDNRASLVDRAMVRGLDGLGVSNVGRGGTGLIRPGVGGEPV